MTIDELFIGTKKIKLEGKTLGQLEHLRQQAVDAVERYKRAIENYPPDRMKNYGEPHLKRLNDTVAAIDAAIKKAS